MTNKNHLLAAALTVGACCSAYAQSTFKLTSSDFKPGAQLDVKQVFKGFGCDGGNLSPTLSWTGAPSGVKSFALLVHDPNAPTGGAGWWHWVVYNIAATVKALPQGAGTKEGDKLPAGAAQAVTDFGATGWGGPCPPKGRTHNYLFTLYALKTDKLDIPVGATASLAGYMINANAIGKATLRGTYTRDK